MRNAFVSLCGFSFIGSLLLVGTAQAAGRRSEMEKSLLGIRLLQTYQNVLAKYGQPARVYRLDEAVRPIYAYDAEGNPTGAVRGLEVDPTAGQAGGRGGLAGGMGGGMGMPGAMMGGGMRGGISGMSGGGFPGAMMGGQGRPMGGPPGGLGFPPGMSAGGMGQGRPMGGPPGGLGMPNGMSYPGAMAGGGMPGAMMGRGMPGAGRTGGLGANTNGQASGRFLDSGGYMWVYFYPAKELLYWFAFNSDGRVIGIREDGNKSGLPTSQGLGLGAAVKKVYSDYGWPDTVDMQETSIAMHYNLKHHVQFNVLNNKVTSIAVYLSEDQNLFNTVNGGGGNLPGGGPQRPGLRMGGGGGPMRPGLRMGGGGGGGKGEGGAD